MKKFVLPVLVSVTIFFASQFFIPFPYGLLIGVSGSVGFFWYWFKITPTSQDGLDKKKMKAAIKLAIIISIIITVGVVSTLAYLIQTDFFISPKRTSGDQWSNTKECPENFVIYKNNCVGIASENRKIHDASMFFRSVDGKITEFCEVDFKAIPEVETCVDTKLYWISDDNVIQFHTDNEDWNSNLNKIQVEDSVRAAIYDLLSDTDVEYYAINLNHKTGIIEIRTSNDSYDSQIKEIISKYPNEIEFDISYVNYTDGIILDDFSESESNSSPEEKKIQVINKFVEYPTIYIITEDGEDKLSLHDILIDLDHTNSVKFVNHSPDPVRIQEIGENKIVNIPQNAWRTKTIAPGEEITIQFNSTGHYEFNVKKITDFLPGYLEHHASGSIVVLSNNTNSLPVDIRAKMAQSIISSHFRDHPALIGVGSGGAPGTGVSIDINKKELELRDDAKSYYYELYRNLIPFDVPITIEFSTPFTFH